MNFAESQRKPNKHPVGLIIVVVMHVLLAYALVSGLGKRIVDAVQPEVVTKLIEEVKPPPPPEKLPPPPAKAPPPPIYVPPPEIQIASPPPPPAMVTTAIAPPPAPAPEPVPIAAPTPAPAPSASPPVSLAKQARVDAGAASCQPTYPSAARRAEAVGTSHIRLTVDANGKVTAAEVIGSSGPTREHRLLDKAAQSALATCPIQAGTDTNGKPVGTVVDVVYVWKLE